MIDPVDRAVRAAARRSSAIRDGEPTATEETRRPMPKGRSEPDKRSPVESNGKQVQVQLWAPRVLQADTFARDPARATVRD
jgi:hypothetical protein